MIPILAGFDSGIQLDRAPQLNPITQSKSKGRDVQSKPSHEQHQRHERERHQQQIPAAKRVDRPHGGAREHEVDRAEAEGGEDRGRLAEPAFHEDVRAVVRDRVHAAELLPARCAKLYQHDDGRAVDRGRLSGKKNAHEHEEGRGLHGAAVPRDGEQFEELAACLLVFLSSC